MDILTYSPNYSQIPIFSHKLCCPCSYFFAELPFVAHKPLFWKHSSGSHLAIGRAFPSLWLSSLTHHNKSGFSQKQNKWIFLFCLSNYLLMLLFFNCSNILNSLKNKNDSFSHLIVKTLGLKLMELLSVRWLIDLYSQVGSQQRLNACPPCLLMKSLHPNKR